MKVVGSTAMYPYVAFSPRERLWRGDNRRCLGTASLESRRKGKSKSAKDKLPCRACPCRMMLLKLPRKESCVWQYAGARYFTTTTRQENGWRPTWFCNCCRTHCTMPWEILYYDDMFWFKSYVPIRILVLSERASYLAFVVIHLHRSTLSHFHVEQGTYCCSNFVHLPYP